MVVVGWTGDASALGWLSTSTPHPFVIRISTLAETAAALTATLHESIQAAGVTVVRVKGTVQRITWLKRTASATRIVRCSPLYVAAAHTPCSGCQSTVLVGEPSVVQRVAGLPATLTGWECWPSGPSVNRLSRSRLATIRG